jgi:hypothetical protein
MMVAICHHVKGDIRPAPKSPLPGHDAGMARTARPASYSDIQREIGLRIFWARELVEPNRAA